MTQLIPINLNQMIQLYGMNTSEIEKSILGMIEKQDGCDKYNSEGINSTHNHAFKSLLMIWKLDGKKHP